MDDSRQSFLGVEGLAELHSAVTTVVGCGGGGSHVAEQLVRLGVGTVNLVDHDLLDASNLGRVIGSAIEDIGTPKVEVVAKRFSWVRTRVVPMRARIQSADAIAAVQGSDFAFGCVDRFRARDDLERICRQALVPFIDVGLGIIVKDGMTISVGGQIALSSPGDACLRCMEIVTEENLGRDKEEYVESGAPEQQVVSMNGLLASEAVNAFLMLVTGYATAFPPPRYIVYNGLTHELGAHPFFGLGPTACPHYLVENAGDRVGIG